MNTIVFEVWLYQNGKPFMLHSPHAEAGPAFAECAAQLRRHVRWDYRVCRATITREVITEQDVPAAAQS